MISATEANESIKYFTHEWTITIPSRPGLKYIRMTPKNIPTWIPVLKDPSNHPYVEVDRAKVWDEAAVADFNANFLKGIIEAKTKYTRLNWLIELDGEIIGGGGLRHLPDGANNIGLLLTEKSRGKGLGKFTVQFAIAFGRRLGIKEFELGTMKANQPMRWVMESLKIPAREEIKEDPQRNSIVAELLYTIPATVSVDNIDMHVEFGDEICVEN
ncbi:hypothetical protein F5884DRAFT_549935 [Xylogone sp. PMI_703]|nr:hypothetical protein F5884DRAFT_549935 [Xylogone sp. PMI_703]